MRKSMETAQMLARRGMQAAEIAEILKTDAAKVKEWIAGKQMLIKCCGKKFWQHTKKDQEYEAGDGAWRKDRMNKG